MKNQVEIIGIGNASFQILNYIIEKESNFENFSVICDNDYNSEMNILNISSDLKRDNFYDKTEIPTSVKDYFKDESKIYILISGLGGVFSSFFTREISDYLYLKKRQFKVISLKPLSFEGNAFRRAEKDIETLSQFDYFRLIDIEKVRKKYKLKTISDCFLMANFEIYLALKNYEILLCEN